MLTTRVTVFNLEMLLMQCGCAFDWTNLPASFPSPLYHSSLFSDTLALCLPPSILASFYPSFHPSLPSLAGLYLLTRLRGNYHSSETLSYCTAMLCPASLPPPIQHTHMDTRKYTSIRILWTCAHTSMHAHPLHTKAAPPPTNRGCITHLPAAI